MKNTPLKVVSMNLNILGCAAFLTTFAMDARAQNSPVLLGDAESYAVLGSSTVTNTGLTVIYGDVGVSPGTAITGFGPGVINDGSMVTGTSANQAHSDAYSAYVNLMTMNGSIVSTGQDLGDSVRYPGLYSFASSVGLTGTLVLDGQGQTNPLFIFQIGSTLVTASDAVVVLQNGATADNVFFQVGSSATLGTRTSFAGTIIAYSSITATTGVNVTSGRLLALNGAVTLDSNHINVPTGLASVPEPSAAMLLIPAAAMLMSRRKRNSLSL